MILTAHFIAGTGTVWTYHTAGGTSRNFTTREEAEGAYREALRASLTNR